ncbi:Hypothetical predicted protein [Olea europaea subsp. europaea]|uniref:Uncharacterized protein n=1 Tax=Olea europaea subsp. europaea TaxID=158383 RepID=A0A8S0R2J0_OLEEU|nr:Hypothetical predicted protein [Olea europaea subsp. europaea]
MMEFEFRIPESARLRAHISQRSNLKYVKIVMDQFDERHREDFRNTSLGYLAVVPDIQFSAQLIQQLVFRTIHTDKLRLLHGFRCTWAKKFQKAKRRKEKEITYTVHGFSIAMQVWAYEALPEVGERFTERVGERLPRLLHWSARKQPQHHTYDAFFKNIKLHVYTTLRPTDAEAQQPYFLTLVSYDEPPIPILDDIARIVVAPQFNTSSDDGHDGRHAAREDSEEEASEGGRSEEQTSGGDEEKGALGSDPDGEDSKDTGESHGEGSSAGEDTRGGARGTSSSPRSLRDPSPERRSTTQARVVGTSAPGLTRGDVEELLLDQRILFEMRLQTVKLEIQQTYDEGRDGGRRLGFFTRRRLWRTREAMPYESDIAIDTGNMQDAGATEPSNDAGDNDEEVDGYDAMDGDGVVTEVPAPGPVLEARAGVPTTRRCLARLHLLVISTNYERLQHYRFSVSLGSPAIRRYDYSYL